MSDKHVKETIQQAMNHTLCGLSQDPFLTQRVLWRAANDKGEAQMKKKISGSLIFAFVMTLLLAGAALAITNWDSLKQYFETVRTMDTEGELARWSDEDKVSLLQAMEEAGLVTREDKRVQTALDASLPLSERGRAASRVIAERYGEDYFDSHTVEQREFPREERSPQEQADYTQWDQQYWSQWNSPEKQPLTESRIYRDTMNHLTEIGEFPRSLLRDVQVSYDFDEQQRTYTVTAAIKKELYLAKRETGQVSLFDPHQSVGYESGDTLCFQFWLDEFGAFLGIKNPNSPQARARLSLKEAQAIAEKALKVRLNADQDALDSLPLRATYSESGEYVQEEGRFRAACTFIWGEKGDTRYMVDIDAQTGRVIKAFDWQASEAILEQSRAWMAQLEELLREAGVSADLFNRQGEYIWQWSLQERAEWSQAARPIVRSFLDEHPEFVRYLEDVLANRYAQSPSSWPNLISLTQYAYGLPDHQAISQDKAFETAREMALSLGASRQYIDENKNHVIYYDVTDPNRPLWKVHISLLFGDADTVHPREPTAPLGYFVVMDAHTGEVLLVRERTVNTGIRELV